MPSLWFPMEVSAREKECKHTYTSNHTLSPTHISAHTLNPDSNQCFIICGSVVQGSNDKWGNNTQSKWSSIFISLKDKQCQDVLVNMFNNHQWTKGFDSISPCGEFLHSEYRLFHWELKNKDKLSVNKKGKLSLKMCTYHCWFGSSHW